MTLPGRPQIPTIDVREAAGAADAAGAGGAAVAAAADGVAEPLLVDVRERKEFLEVRAPGAVLYPTSSFLLRFEEL
ncbi:MAG TPA: rhodanese-like domain-containing protein, partial [Candidatus Nanopelagicales bacterium]|nr:rhodanese-like domain-containing protein [Candidatus Nanopelagicales bacterium]